MKNLYNFTIKNLKTNKKRTIVTIIGIVLSCSLLFGVGFFASTYRENLIREIIEYNGSHHIEYRDLKYSKLNIIKNDFDVKDVLTKVKYVKSGRVLGDGHHTNIEISSLDTDYNNILNIIHGSTPKSNNEVIISENYARKQEIKLNDIITVKNDLDEIKYKVVGIYKSKKEYSSYYYSMYDEEKMYTKFWAEEDSLVDVYVTLDSPKHGIAKLNLLTDKLELQFPAIDFSNSNHQVTVNTALLSAYGEIHNAGVVAVLYLSLMLILTILSVVCILIIYNSFSVSVTERKKQFGILSSVGATPMQILYSVLFEAGIVSLIAIPLGFVFSIINVSLTLTVLNKILEDVISNPFTLSVYPYFILLSLTFVIMTIFLSALFPAVRANEITPIEAIKLSKDIKIKRKNVKTNKLISKIFGVEGNIALKNMKRQKKRYRTTVISLVTSIVLFLTASTYLNAAIKSIKATYESYPYDASLTVSAGENQTEFINKIKNIKEVTDVLEYKFQRFFIKQHDESYFEKGYLNFIKNRYLPGQKMMIVFLLSDNSYQKYIKEIGLKTEQPIFINFGKYIKLNKDDEIDEKYEGPPYKENPNLSFKFCNYEDYPKNEKISDCYYELTNLYYTDTTPFNNYNFYSTLIVNKKIYYELNSKLARPDNVFSNLNNITLELRVKNAKKFDEEVRKIFEDTPNLKFSYQNPKLENYKMQMFQIAVMFALYTFSAFIALIAITSVINTINTSINLRKIEFSMLLSVGQSPKSFTKMIRLESLFLGLKSLLYGLTISYGIIYIITEIASLSYGDNKIKIPFPMSSIIICVFAVFIIIFITMKYSTNKIKNENIIETIRKENI